MALPGKPTKRREPSNENRSCVVRWRRWLGPLLNKHVDETSMTALAQTCREMCKDLPNWPLCFMDSNLASDPPPGRAVIGWHQKPFRRQFYDFATQRLRFTRVEPLYLGLAKNLRVLALQGCLRVDRFSDVVSSLGSLESLEIKDTHPSKRRVNLDLRKNHSLRFLRLSRSRVSCSGWPPNLELLGYLKSPKPLCQNTSPLIKVLETDNLDWFFSPVLITEDARDLSGSTQPERVTYDGPLMIERLTYHCSLMAYEAGLLWAIGTKLERFTSFMIIHSNQVEVRWCRSNSQLILEVRSEAATILLQPVSRECLTQLLKRVFESNSSPLSTSMRVTVVGSPGGTTRFLLLQIQPGV